MTTVLSESTTSELSLDELQTILTYWQDTIDQRAFTEDELNECILAIQQSGQSKEWWLEHLVRLPDHVEQRYRKVVGLLKEKQLIDQAAHDAELQAMAEFSPALMARRGKEFADWLRQPSGGNYV
jgi:hypothetical protein